eukprot:2992646-Prymnesium_polylepis.1
MATTSPALTKPAAHQVSHHLSAEGWSPAQPGALSACPPRGNRATHSRPLHHRPSVSHPIR